MILQHESDSCFNKFHILSFWGCHSSEIQTPGHSSLCCDFCMGFIWITQSINFALKSSLHILLWSSYFSPPYTNIIILLKSDTLSFSMRESHFHFIFLREVLKGRSICNKLVWRRRLAFVLSSELSGFKKKRLFECFFYVFRRNLLNGITNNYAQLTEWHYRGSFIPTFRKHFSSRFKMVS